MGFFVLGTCLMIASMGSLLSLSERVREGYFGYPVQWKFLKKDAVFWTFIICFLLSLLCYNTLFAPYL